LHLFWSIFVPPPEAADRWKAITTVEQMGMSRCYQQSTGAMKLGCVSCHDPHRSPAPRERVAFYRERCLQCHADRGCRLDPKERVAKSAEDSCIACHMPRVASSNIAHFPLTDHAIPRQPRPGTPGPTPPPGSSSSADGLVYYYADRVDSQDPAVLRDLGCALGDAVKNGKRQLAPRAVEMLSTSLERWPEDVEAREYRAMALILQRREREALVDCEAILAQIPEREWALALAGWAAAGSGKRDEAIGYWQRVIAVNPYLAIYHLELARLLVERRDWSAGLASAREALRFNPTHLDARRLALRSLYGLKRRDDARRELEILLGFIPPDAQALRRQYAALLR
jgi:predicted CXXCH cytochrome family protein